MKIVVKIFFGMILCQNKYLTILMSDRCTEMFTKKNFIGR